MRLMNNNNGNEETISKIVYLMQADKSVDAPTDAIRWSKNIFRARVAEPKKSFAQKVLAVLQMDLAPGKAAFGERSASADQARQLFYEAGENGLDLRVKATEKGISVRGQVLGEGFEKATVKLVGANSSFESETNNLSEFGFNLSEFGFVEIPAGNYDLILRKNETEITVEGLELS